MHRRTVIAALMGAAAAAGASHGSRAQGDPVIGFLDSGSPAPFVGRLEKFRQGLADRGYVEGQNVTIEYRWAEGKYERLPSLAEELVERRVSVLTATGSPNTAKAALRATSAIPIVFANGGDPVKLGLVPNLSRPPGNATGVTFFNSALIGKRLEIIRELVPTMRVLGFIVNPSNPNTISDISDAREAAGKLGLELAISEATAVERFDAAFLEAIAAGATASAINNDAFFSSRADDFAALAARHRLPTIYYLRNFVVAGGLLSYGTDIEEMYQRAGVYTARILAGASPRDLPVQQPTKFELIINLKTAKTLGLAVPQSILARADELIE